MTESVPVTEPTTTGASSPTLSTTQSPVTSKPVRGTVITTGRSEFGDMLFDANEQAIYLFEIEGTGRPKCYDECEVAWPPVLTDGRPVAARDVQAGLLGSVQRHDGRTQVTYGGWPLYYYAHEGPGEVKCHNVVLNGGRWLAVGPDGKALP